MGGQDGSQIKLAPVQKQANGFVADKERPALHQPKDYTQLQNDYYDKLAKSIKAQMTPRKESPRIHKQRLSKQRESIPEPM